MITSQLQTSQMGNDAKRRHVVHRQTQVLALHIAGMTRPEIAKRIGVSLRTVYSDLEAINDDRVRAEELIEDACVTAEDAHLKLSKAFDARIQELFDDHWNILPQSQWPEPFKSWGLLTEIKVEDVMVQDQDGDGNTWKKSGGKRVTVKGPDVLKTIELTMKHKAVNAMVHEKAGDINVLVVTAEKARRVVGARKRLAKIVDIQASDTQDVVNEEAKTVSVIRPDATSLDT